MNAKDWLQLSPLVDQALDLAASERAAWVATLPELTDELRARLLRLVAQQGAPETASFLETAPILAASALRAMPHYDPPSTLAMGDVIGSYTLLKNIGVGGMGEVWLARRSDGAYERKVALKLPNTDAAPARIRERMLRERDVLATLEHANIARLYDAGVTPSGQPFIAMEYVEGETLGTYAELHQLSTRDRCALFLQVLAAVQFAHQRLVVHRDLKPSNIMVRHDGRVSLLDFGIAKVLEEETLLGTESQLTRDTGRALTLAYAAPEQVLSEPVSTGSDVFAAGVLFYELLCYERPFFAAEKSMAAMIAAHNAPLKTMPGDLGRDLNAIVAKALRHNAADRYPSAAAFADDVQRYLSDQPVLAVQGARWYSISKFVRRERTALAIGVAGVVTAIGLGIGTFVQWQTARAEAASSQTVRTLVEGLVSGMSPDNAETRLFTAKELLDRSLQALSGQALQPDLALKFGEVYRMISEPKQAISLMDRALPFAEAKSDYAMVVKLLAYKALAQLEADQTNDAKATLKLARAHTSAAVGNGAGTEVTDPVVLGVLSLVEGNVALTAGDMAAAENSYAHSRKKFEQSQSNPDDLLTYVIGQQSQLARDKGNILGALAILREAQDAARQYGERGGTLRNYRDLALGDLQLALGRPDEAVRVLTRAHNASDKRFSEDGAGRLWSAVSLAGAQWELGDTDAATQTFALVRPHLVGAPFALRRNALILENRLKAHVNASGAIAALDDLLKLRVPDEQGNALDRFDEAVILRHTGEILLLQAKPDAAIARFESARNLSNVRGASPSLLSAKIDTAMAVAYLQIEQFDQASNLLASAHRTYVNQLGQTNPVTQTALLYKTLADEASQKTVAASAAIKANRQEVTSQIRADYGAPRRAEPLFEWIAMVEGFRRWREMPVFLP